MKNRVYSKAKLLLVIGLIISFCASANESDSSKILTEEKSDIQKQSKEDIEVIGVVGEKPISFYRDQMKLAETAFYDMYNSLADKKKFKIKCRKEKQTGSHIKRKVCYPQYVLDRFAKETQLALTTSSPLPTIDKIQEMVTKEKAESSEYMKQIILENPPLFAQYKTLNASVAMYKQKKGIN